MAQVNNPQAGSYVNAPRATLKLADQPQSGLLSFNCDQNTNYQANTFRAEITIQSEDGLQFPEWATIAKGEDATLKAEILVGEAGQEKTVFVGLVDEFDVDMAGGKISLRGRDNTSLLIERKTTNKFTEVYGFEVIRQLAEDANITKTRIVQDRSLPLVGAYLDNVHASLSTSRKYWDYMTWIAQTENYLLYFDGETLVYEPDPAGASEEKPAEKEFLLVYDRSDPLQPWSNALSVNFRRSLTISRDILVEVRSVSLWEGNIRAQARSAVGKRPQTRGGDAQVFTSVTENLDRDQAQKLAEQRARQITARQVQLNAQLPGGSAIDPTTKVKVSGTGSDFDQDFYVDHLIREWDARRGYTLTLKAKNHATATTVSA